MTELPAVEPETEFVYNDAPMDQHPPNMLEQRIEFIFTVILLVSVVLCPPVFFWLLIRKWVKR